MKISEDTITIIILSTTFLVLYPQYFWLVLIVCFVFFYFNNDLFRIKIDTFIKDTVVKVRKYFQKDQSIKRGVYEILLGYSDLGKPVFLNLKQTYHIGLFTQTGLGKSRTIHRMIYEIISNFSPQEFQIALIDIKGTGFRIYRSLDHLMKIENHSLPVAQMDEANRWLTFLYKEMFKRSKLYDQVPKNLVCESLDDYHKIVRENNLDLPNLPWVVIFMDEVGSIISQHKDNAHMVNKLFQQGRSYGFRIVAASQRSTNVNIDNEASSQMNVYLVGFMDNPHEYRVAKAPKDLYINMRYEPGVFMLKNKGFWSMVKIKNVSNSELEKIALRHSKGKVADWQDFSKRRVYEEIEIEAQKISFNGSAAQKKALVLKWMEEKQFPTKPKVEDFMSYFDVKSQNTAAKWINTVWRLK